MPKRPCLYGKNLHHTEYKDGVCRVHRNQVAAVRLAARSANYYASIPPEPVAVQSTGEEYGFEIAEAIDLIDEYVYEIEFLNHSPNSDEECLTLDRMSEQDIAINNCHAATAVVLENLISTHRHLKPQQIHVTFADGKSHYAVVVSDEEEGTFVLDYSYAQYDPYTPFPMVAPVERWKNMVDEKGRALHDTQALLFEIE